VGLRNSKSQIAEEKKPKKDGRMTQMAKNCKFGQNFNKNQKV
jgi:hypothetical protein